MGTPSGIHQQDIGGAAGEVVIGIWGRKGLNMDALGLLVAPMTPPAPPSTRPSAGMR